MVFSFLFAHDFNPLSIYFVIEPAVFRIECLVLVKHAVQVFRFNGDFLVKCVVKRYDYCHGSISLIISARS